MPTNNDFDLTSGFITWNGHKIDNIIAVNLVAEEFEAQPLTFTRDKDMSFSGEFNFVLPKKFSKKTLDFYRRCFGIDLLTRKFPKKKNRRFIRIKRRVREWRQTITHGKGWTI